MTYDVGELVAAFPSSPASSKGAPVVEVSAGCEFEFDDEKAYPGGGGGIDVAVELLPNERKEEDGDVPLFPSLRFFNATSSSLDFPASMPSSSSNGSMTNVALVSMTVGSQATQLSWSLSLGAFA